MDAFLEHILDIAPTEIDHYDVIVKDNEFYVDIDSMDKRLAYAIRRSPYFQWDVRSRNFCGSVCWQTVSELERIEGVRFSPEASAACEYINARQLIKDRSFKIRKHFVDTKEMLPGFEVDAPFKTTPYTHQKVALAASISQPGMGLLMEMGTGKTKVSIDRACVELMYSDLPWYRMVVIAPKSILRNWEDELEKHSFLPYVSKVLSGSTEGKADSIIQEFLPEVKTAMDKYPKVLSVIIVNYEAIHKLLPLFEVWKPDLTIFDETSQIKNSSAKRSKASIKLRELSRQGMILNGTALAKSPLDLWSQFECAESGALGFKSYHAFKNRYAVQIDRWRTASANLPELKRSIAQSAFIINKKDCLDLPEKVYEPRYVDMSPDQMEAYKTMRDEMLLEINEYVSQAEARDENPAIIAQHILTQMLRLCQITSGFVQDKREGLLKQFSPNAKLEELKALLEEVEGKVIVWCRFIENIKFLQKNLNGEACILYGAIPEHKRHDIVNEFNNSSDKRILVAHPQVGGFGLNLIGNEQQPVNTVVYFSHDFNYTWRKQSEDRAHRTGMFSKSVTYVDLLVPSSIDTAIMKNLEVKDAIAGEFKNPKDMIDEMLRSI